MKRFITVTREHAGKVLQIIGTAAAGGFGTAAGADAYHWLIQQLNRNGVPYKDQSASHPNQLPHQGGYVSFFIGSDGRWTQANH